MSGFSGIPSESIFSFTKFSIPMKLHRPRIQRKLANWTNVRNSFAFHIICNLDYLAITLCVLSGAHSSRICLRYPLFGDRNYNLTYPFLHIHVRIPAPLLPSGPPIVLSFFFGGGGRRRQGRGQRPWPRVALIITEVFVVSLHIYFVGRVFRTPSLS